MSSTDQDARVGVGGQKDCHNGLTRRLGLPASLPSWRAGLVARRRRSGFGGVDGGRQSGVTRQGDGVEGKVEFADHGVTERLLPVTWTLCAAQRVRKASLCGFQSKCVHAEFVAATSGAQAQKARIRPGGLSAAMTG